MTRSSSEVRYDLEVPYEGLDLETSAKLFVLTGRWQAQDSKLRAERLRQEAEGPAELQ